MSEKFVALFVISNRLSQSAVFVALSDLILNDRKDLIE
jgi:hypothetical protein